MAEPSCGFVAVLGAPNVGKSTLVNRFVGTKVSIVTPKVQTTRNRVIGIALAGDAQIVFIDTPGVFAPKKRLERAMVSAAWSGARDADIVLMLIDAKRGLDKHSRLIVEHLCEGGSQALLGINKIDTVERKSLLALAAEFDAEKLADGSDMFSAVFMISALTGDGVDDLQDALGARMLAGPWHYPADQAADMPMRLLAAEVTREKVFLQLQQELPYAIAVETEAWRERDDGSVRVDQVLYVRRDSQKSIVLGKDGRRVKAIGSEARHELQEMLGRSVHLFIHVKVRDGWQDDPERYRDLGLDFDA
ncbi:MAG: GTPase Era [Alphaproteobacteria bacterium]|jgi:GTP-binding protein Era|nr:GTPase Era [Alphaproteobacteria bacterium]HJM60287.1 GTPase Era [Alphaproteobacteria bacterium]